MTAILDDLSGWGVDRILCLGDLVGYGADPGACLSLIRERAHAVVAGNHDYAVVGLTPLVFFNPYARAAAEWTSGELCQDDKAWLKSLPLVSQVGAASLVHASPRHPEEWEYLLSREDGEEVFSSSPTPVCFLGHSHIPGVWIRERTRVTYHGAPERTELDPGCRYLINVGSVGQPRDRDPRAAYAIWDDGAGWVEWIRVPYAIPPAQEKILSAGLPRFLSERLARGA